MSFNDLQRNSENPESAGSDTDCNKDTRHIFPDQRSLDSTIQSKEQQFGSPNKSSRIGYWTTCSTPSVSVINKGLQIRSKGSLGSGYRQNTSLNTSQSAMNIESLEQQFGSKSKSKYEYRPTAGLNISLSDKDIQSIGQQLGSTSKSKNEYRSNTGLNISGSATNIQFTGQFINTSESKEKEHRRSTNLNISQSASKPLPSATKQNKGIFPRPSDLQDIDRFMSQLRPGSSHSFEEEHSSNLSNPEIKRDVLNSASGSAKTAGPKPFKGFALSPADIPISKEKISETLSLEEACGFLPYLVKTKKGHIIFMENQLDQLSIELQKTLRDAKNICILLENAPRDVPQDINTARVQAQKLNYLLSSSFRIFESLYQCGLSLKEKIEQYSQHTGDYHSSVDVLLEYIMETILERCRQVQGNI